MEDRKFSKNAINCTDVDYLDESAFCRKLGIFTGDFFKEVENYRLAYAYKLPFNLINNNRIFLVRTPALLEKWQKVGDSIKSFCETIRKTLNEKEKKEARKTFFLSCLKTIAQLEKNPISELSLKALLNGTYCENNTSHYSIIAYLNALDFYSGNKAISVDEDFLAEIYAKMQRVEELTSFYREEESSSRSNLLYNYNFDKAPAGHIEDFMDPFLRFINTERENSPIVSVAAALFYIPYVVPFDQYNLEVALLFAKETLALYYGEEAFFLPIEQLLLPTNEFLTAKKDVKATGDITYFVSYIAKNMKKVLQESEENIKTARISVYSSEYNQLSEEEKAFIPQTEESSLPSNNPEPTLESFINEEKPLESIVQSIKETSKDREEAQGVINPNLETMNLPNEDKRQDDIGENLEKGEIISETVPPCIKEPEAPILEKEETLTIKEPLVEKKIEEIKENKKEKVKPLKANISVSKPSSFENYLLNEKETKEYTRYLLETNPNLNKKQASFLANHCTPGRYYNIQQFKNFTRCVYETARTSMDKLASEGYYEKRQIKNKFVYTPKITKGN